MCGIFGLVAGGRYSESFLHKTLRCLALLSESRGKESSGFVFRRAGEQVFTLLKGPIPVSRLIREKRFYEAFSLFAGDQQPVRAVIGHSRLVTHGSMLSNENNQPVMRDGIIGVHNGIIVNYKELWEDLTDQLPQTELDTEAMMAHIARQIPLHSGFDQAIQKVSCEVTGTLTTALFYDTYHALTLATNNGSLYYLTNHTDFLVFGSEQFILRTLAEKMQLDRYVNDFIISQVGCHEGIIVNLSTFGIQFFGAAGPGKEAYVSQKPFTSELIAFDNPQIQLDTLVNMDQVRTNGQAVRERKLLEYNELAIQRLKRCSKCLLPETFPHISFDEQGVCSICQHYRLRNQPMPVSGLEELVLPYRSINNSPDVIVPFSGGRDSSYALHFIKKELGLNPITFTFDWGMVTDLARRNVARICGELGVENIIVSANITHKRRNIRKNVLAWLRKPDLGMIPLFMAGDKEFHYYVRQLKKQTGIHLNIWGENRLENTDFKVGFSGVRPDFDKKTIYSLKAGNAARLGLHITRNFLTNFNYFNVSLFDNIHSSLSRFLPKTDYYNLYDFVQWNEDIINSTIINTYGWECASDTRSTWRIGDGTAAFYNYIYYTVAGFTEFDTFRSNQIREGMLKRDEALTLVQEENHPRYETIRWYLDIIGVDFETTIKRINQIPKLYAL